MEIEVYTVVENTETYIKLRRDKTDQAKHNRYLNISLYIDTNSTIISTSYGFTHNLEFGFSQYIVVDHQSPSILKNLLVNDTVKIKINY